MADSSPLSSPAKTPVKAAASRNVPARGAATRARANVRSQVASTRSSDDEDLDEEEDETDQKDSDEHAYYGNQGKAAHSPKLAPQTRHHRAAYGKNAVSRPARKAKPKGRTTPSRGNLLDQSSSSGSPSMAASKTTSKPAGSRSMRRPSQPTVVADPPSSPLSSLPPSPKKTPAKRRASTPGPSPISSPSKRARLSSASMPTSSQWPAQVNSSPRKLKDVNDDWQLDKLEGVVWVRIDGSRRPVGCGGSEQGAYWWPARLTNEVWEKPLELDLFDDEDVDQSQCKLELPVPSSSNILSFMSPFTLRPRFDLQTSHLPHTPPAETASVTGALASPSKRLLEKRKYDEGHERRWEAAVAQALRAQEEELPEWDEAAFIPSQSQDAAMADGASLSTPKRKTDAKNGAEARWVDRGPDPSFQIPGEPVLALWRKLYYPAQVREYIPGQPGAGKNKGSGRYRVFFFDGIQRSLRREDIYGVNEDGFVTCELGDFTGRGGDEIISNSDAESSRSLSPPIPSPPGTLKGFSDLPLDDQVRHVRSTLELTLHSVYPPTLSRCEAFYKGGKERSMLARGVGAEMGPFEDEERGFIMNEVRRWALRDERKGKREDADVLVRASPDDVVMKDGTGETIASSSALPSESGKSSPRGSAEDMSVDGQGTQPCRTETDHRHVRLNSDMDVDEIQERHTDKVMGNGGTKRIHTSASNSTGPVRPRGCPNYEALTETERSQFCTDIIVPEAVVQLLAWRDGLRFKTPPLPAYVEPYKRPSASVLAAEAELYDKASQLAQLKPTSNWISKIISDRGSRMLGIRALREKNGTVATEEKLVQPKRLAGSSTRPHAGRRIGC